MQKDGYSVKSYVPTSCSHALRSQKDQLQAEVVAVAVNSPSRADRRREREAAELELEDEGVSIYLRGTVSPIYNIYLIII